MAWLLMIAQSEAPEPLLPESSSWEWVLPVGVVILVGALVVAFAVYTVRSRRLATQALTEVDEVRHSLGGRFGPST
jgi:cytochrome c-type biogenesis protein CcmH/NrfF